ncbi:hypothetical protein VNO77_08290 [Canavalia gladiata]|uniref:Uncharacterized protein n=1 Tax=Canavalia gladiata TaxID=3824 RepID=A0AAN9MF24_CANGL
MNHVSSSKKVPLETQLRLISSLPDAELFPHSKRSSFLEKDDDVIPDFLRDQCRLQASEKQREKLFLPLLEQSPKIKIDPPFLPHFPSFIPHLKFPLFFCV